MILWLELPKTANYLHSSKSFHLFLNFILNCSKERIKKEFCLSLFMPRLVGYVSLLCHPCFERVFRLVPIHPPQSFPHAVNCGKKWKRYVSSEFLFLAKEARLDWSGIWTICNRCLNSWSGVWFVQNRNYIRLIRHLSQGLNTIFFFYIVSLIINVLNAKVDTFKHYTVCSRKHDCRYSKQSDKLLVRLQIDFCFIECFGWFA